MNEASFTEVFSEALRGRACVVHPAHGPPSALPFASWRSAADVNDLELIDHCEGPTLDVGCGPGRLTVALAERGQVALGIDVVHEAVDQTRARGAAALRRDIFGAVPGEGRWHTALLADGNVGIGGDPVGLLRRLRRLLLPGGRVVVEVAPPGVTTRSMLATLECEGIRSRPFRWSLVGVDGIGGVATSAGLTLRGRQPHGARWSAVLEDRS
jgi:SAM-dependent methyltransferase